MTHPNPSDRDKAEGDRDAVRPDVRNPTDESESRAANSQDIEAPSNLQKDPSEWKTGDESMTDAQRSYLKTLSGEAGEPFDDGMTKADASRRIDELQHKTGRGISR